MKTTVKAIALTLALAALPGLAQMGIYSFGIGPFNNASNSNYATTTGYYAGGGAQGDSRTSLYGSMAGLYSAYVQRSVGIGAGAFYMASNCYDCVAIGDGAGAKWRNRTGWVDVGGAFVYTNGVAHIKAEQGAKIGPLEIDSTGLQHTLTGDLTIYEDDNGVGGHVYCGNLWAESVFADVHATSIGTSELKLSPGAECPVKIQAEDGRLCVYTNDVFAGYLTITPPAAAQQ